VPLTGYGQHAHTRRSSEARFDRHLVKPLDFPARAEISARLRVSDSGETRGNE
jgi:hypothetical protein